MKKTKKHEKYYTIPAYQILAQKTDKQIACLLGCSIRTYKDKIEGWSHFSSEQGKILSNALGVSQDRIFLTKNELNSTHFQD